MIAVEIAGILSILGGIFDLIPQEGFVSAPVMINIGAILLALGSLGVAKIYDGETLLGDGGFRNKAGIAAYIDLRRTRSKRDVGEEDDEEERKKNDLRPSAEEGQSISSGSGASPDFVVKAAVKERLGGHTVSSDFYEALDEEVAEMIEDAANRAEESGRETIQPRDL